MTDVTDLYIANDGTPNYLFYNNGDGLMDIFVTNFSEETNNLYRNNGDGTFTDIIYEVNLGDPTYLPVGF
ncbi:TPA: VCBS repeat-containing protein, partial [Candidatus Poribacteria bacterium]|nr:VCBS repeat-containing protein [Candidatus Poribacteria bacterium]